VLDAKIVEQRFRESESILDGQLARVRDAYVQSGYEVIDQSNRSGFDKSGFPFYKWEHVIRRDDRTGSGVRRTQVTLYFLQPTDVATPRLHVRWWAEAFRVGSPSWFKRGGIIQPSMEQVQKRGIRGFVKKGLSKAESELAALP
jgi:hypothetical protein